MKKLLAFVCLLSLSAFGEVNFTAAEIAQEPLLFHQYFKLN